MCADRRDQESADKGKGPPSRDRRTIAKGRAKGKRSRRHPVAHQRHRDYNGIEDAISYIESRVFEDRQGESGNYAKAQPLLKSDAIFASNTSTLPINFAGGRVQGPEQVHRHSFLLAGSRR